MMEEKEEIYPNIIIPQKPDEAEAESVLSDLLPCPFCGADAFIWPAMIMKGFRVSCKNDCVSMPSRPDSAFTSEKQAKAHWNSRARIS
jgi:hypothetical protein